MKYRVLQRRPMAAKKGPGRKAGGGKKRRRKKLRLTLKSRKIQQTDSYTDQLGWETSGRALEDPNANKAPTEPQFIRHQCSLCGSIMQVPKPKRSRYKITCPNCEHEDTFE